MNKVKDSHFPLTIIGNKHLQAAGVLILFLMVFYRDVIFYGRTFLMETAAPGTMSGGGPYNYKGTKPGFVVNDPGAIAWQIEPFNRFISKSVKNGDFPLWNPYAGLAGAPLLADGHTGPLEPVQFLFFFTPVRFWAYAMDLQLLIRFFIAGFGCYLFARRLKLDFWNSIAVGAIFMFSSYFVTFGNHPQVKTEVLLPWVLYGYDRLTVSKDKFGLWLCASLIGWSVIAAMPESTFFGLFLGSLWYFYKSALSKHHIEGTIINAIKTIILRYLKATVIGFMISAAYLLPFLEYVLISKNVHSTGSGVLATPLWGLPNLIFQVQNAFYMQVGFFSVFSLLYLLLSFINLPEYRRSIAFFSAYAIVVLLAIFDFPLTNWIRQLPVLNQIVLRKYAMPSIVFCLAVLSGTLIESIKQIPPSRKKISFSLLILFTIFIGLPVLGSPSKSLSSYFTSNVAMNSSLAFIAGASAAIYLLSYLYQYQDISTRVMQSALLILAVAGPFYSSNIISRPNRVDPYQTPPFVDYLQKDGDLFRIFGLDGFLYPNISTAYRLSDVRWLNALIPQRAYTFSTEFIESVESKTSRLTGTVFPISDKMFDLLNIKYVISMNQPTKSAETCLPNNNTQPYFGSNTINDLILEQNPNKKNKLLETNPNINGITRSAILAHPPQEFSVKLSIPKEPSRLSFSIGLSPQVFLPDRGDGVDYQITLLDNENRSELFSKYIDPKHNPCDRKWFNEKIDLNQWAGKTVVLRFSTGPGPAGDTFWDWAYWGELRLESTAESNQADSGDTIRHLYNLIYHDNEVQIYRNPDVFPRAFVVYDVMNVSNFNDSLAILSDQSIDHKRTAVVENLPAELENQISRNDSQVQFVDANARLVNSGQLDVKVNTESPGLLVVTDQYYPGWVAIVDGKQEPIYAVDGIFRGVFLERGDHIVQFKYRPLSFIIGAIISSLSLLITVVFVIYRSKGFPQKYE